MNPNHNGVSPVRVKTETSVDTDLIKTLCESYINEINCPRKLNNMYDSLTEQGDNFGNNFDKMFRFVKESISNVHDLKLSNGNTFSRDSSVDFLLESGVDSDIKKIGPIVSLGCNGQSEEINTANIIKGINNNHCDNKKCTYDTSTLMNIAQFIKQKLKTSTSNDSGINCLESKRTIAGFDLGCVSKLHQISTLMSNIRPTKAPATWAHEDIQNNTNHENNRNAKQSEGNIKQNSLVTLANEISDEEFFECASSDKSLLSVISRHNLCSRQAHALSVSDLPMQTTSYVRKANKIQDGKKMTRDISSKQKKDMEKGFEKKSKSGARKQLRNTSVDTPSCVLKRNTVGESLGRNEVTMKSHENTSYNRAEQHPEIAVRNRDPSPPVIVSLVSNPRSEQIAKLERSCSPKRKEVVKDKLESLNFPKQVLDGKTPFIVRHDVFEKNRGRPLKGQNHSLNSNIEGGPPYLSPRRRERPSNPSILKEVKKPQDDNKSVTCYIPTPFEDLVKRICDDDDLNSLPVPPNSSHKKDSNTVTMREAPGENPYHSHQRRKRKKKRMKTLDYESVPKIDNAPVVLLPGHPQNSNTLISNEDGGTNKELFGFRRNCRKLYRSLTTSNKDDCTPRSDTSISDVISHVPKVVINKIGSLSVAKDQTLAVANDETDANRSLGKTLYNYMNDVSAFATSTIINAKDRLRKVTISGEHPNALQESSMCESDGSDSNSDVARLSSVYQARSPPRATKSDSFSDNNETDSIKKILTPLQNPSESNPHQTSAALSDIVAELRQINSKLNDVLNTDEFNKGSPKSSLSRELGSKIKHGITGILLETDNPTHTITKDTQKHNSAAENAFISMKSPAMWIAYAKDKLNKSNVMERFKINGGATSIEKVPSKQHETDLSADDSQDDAPDTILHKSRSLIEQFGLEDYLTSNDDGDPKKELVGFRRNCRKLYRTINELRAGDRDESTTDRTGSLQNVQSAVVQKSQSNDGDNTDVHITDDDISHYDDSVICGICPIESPDDSDDCCNNGSGDSWGCDSETGGRTDYEEETSDSLDSSLSSEKMSQSIEDICADVRLAARAVEKILPSESDQDKNYNNRNNELKGMNEGRYELVNI